jgi:hypothetical protein
MPSNLDRYKNDLNALIDKGENLNLAMQAETLPEQFEKEIKKFGAEEKRAFREFIKDFSFKETYQGWYSEAKALVKQILPDRFSDFASHYEKPKTRKDITYENYRIEDYLQDLRITRTIGERVETIVGPYAAIPQFRQQLAILKSAKARFESSLFDIRLLVQADLIDSELNVAEELAKNKFLRASGAIAGVVLEKHLAQVCDNHSIKLAKREPTISDLNDALKNGGVVDLPQWRSVQHLGDLRNLCCHNRNVEPTPEQVDDLVAGVKKVTKNLF